MKMLRAVDYRRMPWKNGGGETLEVAVFPRDAEIADFGWRISMAIVAVDGPFSTFPGIDRTLVLLDGEGMTLDIAGRSPVTLKPDSPPCTFPADIATTATLTDGPITDLNVMTARGRYTHIVERFDAPRELRADPAEMLLLLGAGLSVETAGESVALGLRDVVLLDAGEAVQARPAQDGGCLLMSIRPIEIGSSRTKIARS